MASLTLLAVLSSARSDQTEPEPEMKLTTYVQHDPYWGHKMSLDRHSYKWLIVGLVASIALVAPVLIFWNHHVKARASRSGVRQVESHDFGSRMVDYIKKGRYDDAVRVGLQSLQNGPSDESVYQQIASVYLIRAQKDDPSQRERWVAMAVSNIEKALSLNSRDKDVAGVHLFLDAQSFKVAGDLSTTGRCAYYQRATQLLEDRVPLLEDDQLTLEGKAYPLAPLRKENERTLADVKGRATNTGCQ